MNRSGGTQINQSRKDKSKGKTNGKSANKSIEKDNSRGSGRSTCKSSVKGSVKCSDKSTDKCSDKSTDKCSDKSTDKCSDKNIDECIDKNIYKSKSESTNKNSGGNASKSIDNGIISCGDSSKGKSISTGKHESDRINSGLSIINDNRSIKEETNNTTNSSPKCGTNQGGNEDDYYAILEELAKSETPKFRSVKDSMDENLNLEFLRSSSENYTYKITSRGPVCYSALYRDDKYVYRHIILSDNVRQYAENKVRKTNAFLTEHCIVNELQIDIGKGWKHFMIYDGKIRELILRKVLTAEDKLRMAVQAQKYN